MYGKISVLSVFLALVFCQRWRTTRHADYRGGGGGAEGGRVVGREGGRERERGRG